MAKVLGPGMIVSDEGVLSIDFEQIADHLGITLDEEDEAELARSVVELVSAAWPGVPVVFEGKTQDGGLTPEQVARWMAAFERFRDN